MELHIYGNDGIVSANQFFNRYNEFSVNKDLAEQTSRILKVMLRHPNDIPHIADCLCNGYSFTVSGKDRTYTVVFDLEGDAIILKDLY